MNTVRDIKTAVSGLSWDELMAFKVWFDSFDDACDDTDYLLKSETMRKRLLKAKERKGGSPLKMPSKSLEFDQSGFEDLAWWIKKDHNRIL